MAARKRIFGLSIDEDVRWSSTTIDPQTGQLSKDLKHGVLFDLRSEDRVDLHGRLLERLNELKIREPEIFSTSMAVGVSTVGIVDSTRNALINFDRRSWVQHRRDDVDASYIVNFSALFAALFEQSGLVVSVQNDASAKGLAEFEQKQRATPKRGAAPPDLLFYASFHDGVNGAFVRYLPGSSWVSAPVQTMMHQELGHISPPMHPHDNFHEAHSGCPVHVRCFVGIASGARIRKQWGGFLPDLKFHPDRPWPIMAHYIAHFCYNAVLTMPPTRIILAGNMICADLLPRIRVEFEELNSFQERRYIDYSALRAPDFISQAVLPVEAAGMFGSLELARRALIPSAELVSFAQAREKINA